MTLREGILAGFQCKLMSRSILAGSGRPPRLTQIGRVVSTAESEGLVYTIRQRPRPK
jgi:hypothetical protein